MRYLAITLMVLSGSAACAQAVPDQQPIKPITVSPEEYAELMSYLNSKPYEFSAPVVTFLTQKEEQAQKTPEKK